ncbi:MAG: hypothetical protein Q8L85_01625 [Alphaproteobacteria bacterium]|nr:hypothetical protein [Alphaproteobacteria bacterium]
MKKALLAFLLALQLTSVNANPNPDITSLLKTIVSITQKVNDGFAKIQTPQFFRLNTLDQQITMRNIEENNINKNKLTKTLISIIQKSPNPDALLDKLIQTITQLGPQYNDTNMRLLHDVLSAPINEQTALKFAEFAYENSVGLCNDCSSKLLSFPKLKEEYYIENNMIYSNNTNSDSENEYDSSSDEENDEDESDEEDGDDIINLDKLNLN